MKANLVIIVLLSLLLAVHGGVLPSSSQTSSASSSASTSLSQTSSASSSARPSSSQTSSASSSAGGLGVTPSTSASPVYTATYGIFIAGFQSGNTYTSDDVIAHLATTFNVSQSRLATSPPANAPNQKRDVPDTRVYLNNVVRGSALETFVTNVDSWLPIFNNISDSNVPASDVSVYILGSPSSSISESPSTGAVLSSSQSASASPTGIQFFPTVVGIPSSSASSSFSASPSLSPSASTVTVSFTFANISSSNINSLTDLYNILAQVFNVSASRFSTNKNAKRDLSPPTVYLSQASPSLAAYAQNPSNWLPRFNSLASSSLRPQDVSIRQESTTSTSTFSPTPSPSRLPAVGSCPFQFPINASEPYCLPAGQTLYLPFAGPISSDALSSLSVKSVTICITVNDIRCSVPDASYDYDSDSSYEYPANFKRQATTFSPSPSTSFSNPNSTCDTPFARFWSQWDACKYGYSNSNNLTSIPQTDIAGTCDSNRTTDQISYLGTFTGPWSFAQQNCINPNQVIRKTTNDKRNNQPRQETTTERRCYCVPVPEGGNFGTGDRFFTEFSLFQTEDSGVPSSIRVTCNDNVCGAAGGGLVGYAKYDSSNDRALVLGIVLGFGLPCLFYCICAIILAILILLLLLLLGKSTTAKTFWVPSRDDL